MWEEGESVSRCDCAECLIKALGVKFLDRILNTNIRTGRKSRKERVNQIILKGFRHSEWTDAIITERISRAEMDWGACQREGKVDLQEMEPRLKRFEFSGK